MWLQTLFYEVGVYRNTPLPNHPLQSPQPVLSQLQAFQATMSCA